MTETTLWGLTTAAGFIGLTHTLAGPDHYIPFIAMARVGRWSLPRTVAVTALCGVGHVLGSILLGAVGIGASRALERLVAFEGLRGDLAAWLLLAFGVLYLLWGLRRASLNRPHTHVHIHADGTVHRHPHGHHGEHAHVHPAPGGAGRPESSGGRMTPWILFTIFVFGPCEPLIPLLMYPAVQHSGWGVALVSGVFACATIGTMLAIVVAAYHGFARLRLGPLERYSHALAGAALAACAGLMLIGL